MLGKEKNGKMVALYYVVGRTNKKYKCLRQVMHNKINIVLCKRK